MTSRVGVAPSYPASERRDAGFAIGQAANLLCGLYGQRELEVAQSFRRLFLIEQYEGQCEMPFGIIRIFFRQELAPFVKKPGHSLAHIPD